jgi:hypothetical protein
MYVPDGKIEIYFKNRTICGHRVLILWNLTFIQVILKNLVPTIKYNEHSLQESSD